MRRTVVCSVALLLFSLQPLFADGIVSDPVEQFKQYLNETVTEVKNADDPVEKRARLGESLQQMREAADQAKHVPGVNAEEAKALAAFSADISDKLDQLKGNNGYERVADGDLDRFADYVQQDLEQAQRLVISISTAALALIVFLLLLI